MLGFLLGVVIGLLPGMHINTFAPFLSSNTLFSGATIFGAAAVANFFEFFKSSIFFSPDEGKILLTHPINKMMMEGKMVYALKLFSLGAILGCLFSCLFAPILIWALPAIIRYISPFSGWIILMIMVHLIARDRSPKNAVLLFIVSGVLGSAVFLLRMENPLMPMLTGLFGVSSLLLLKKDIPAQMEKVAFVADRKEVLKGSAMGFLSSLILGMVPAIGPSQASMVGMEFEKQKREEVFITSIASINTSDIFISLITYITIGRARLGAFLHFPNEPSFLFPLLLSGLLTCLLAFAVMFFLGPRMIRRMVGIDARRIKVVLLTFVSGVALLLAGVPGLLLMAASAAIGYYFDGKTIRSHAMGCLIVPLLLGFL